MSWDSGPSQPSNPADDLSFAYMRERELADRIRDLEAALAEAREANGIMAEALSCALTALENGEQTIECRGAQIIVTKALAHRLGDPNG